MSAPSKTNMPEYDNRNSFIAFPNDRKQKDSHPDYTGKFTDADGVEYFCDIWKKNGAKGTFLTGRIKPKTESKRSEPNL